MTTAILDAATGREALQLAKELKKIREGIAGLSGRAALTAAKRIREIRQALGIGIVTKPISPLDEFENNGGEPWQVTQSKWVEIMSGHFAFLGQDGDVSDFKEFHKSMVKQALDAGNPVPEEVLADYPGMKAETSEEKEARYKKTEERLNGLIGVAAGEKTTIADANATEIIATFKDVEDNMEVRVAKISTGYSVTIKDLDSGEVSPFGNIYKDKDTAIQKAKEAARISETPDAGGASKPQATIADVNAVMPLIKQFIGKPQLAAMGAGVRGEEGQFFKDKFVEVAKVIEGMPKTYETDGQGDKAIAYLHYFKGAGDWYITEKDSDPDGEGQAQAFGYADLGQGGELGYISIQELIGAGVQLDLYWSPKSIGAIKGKSDPEPAPAKEGLSEVQKMKDAIISWGGEVVLEMNESAISFKLRGAEYNDIQPPYLKFDEGMYQVRYGGGFADKFGDVRYSDEFTDKFGDPWKAIEVYSIAKKQQANTMTTGTGQQNPLKTAFIAELEGLKVETDIEAYNSRLDEIAARVEAAGLMDELDAELNSAADVLTVLLAAAEKRKA